MGVQSATQVVAMIDSRFPEAKNWTKWWRKRAHLIMEADMSLHKPEDIMASYPTTDNNLSRSTLTSDMPCPGATCPCIWVCP